MKTTSITFVLVMWVSLLFSQAIDSDRSFLRAELTSVMRLSITSGGNINFVFNTIAQYKNGVSNSAIYDTQFTVSSANSYDVLLYAEDASLLGLDNSVNSIALDNIGYTIEYTYAGVGKHDVGAGAGNEIELESSGGNNPSLLVELTNTATNKAVEKSTEENYGSSAINQFKIHWRCGTKENSIAGSMNTKSILQESVSDDSYITNVMLILQEAP